MQRTSTWAVVSLVCALLGLCSKGALAIPGLICGYVALNEIRNSGGTIGGEGMAKAGIIISYVVIGLAALALIVIFVFGFQFYHIFSGTMQELSK